MLLRKISFFLEKNIFKFWWLILFALSFYMLYEQGLRKRQQEFEKLKTHWEYLQRQKKEALHIQKNLLLQIQSQSDPTWIELTLMKNLSVVPEEQTKIFFSLQNQQF